MPKFSDKISDEHRGFIEKQHMFFVSTAPLNSGEHINLSPKGLDTFRVLSPNRVAYMDYTGSGNETSAHLLENGRITFMLCAFNGPPNIMRLYGKGYTVLPGDAEWNELSKLFTISINTRQIIVADIDKLQTSCGFGVPFYEFSGDRDFLQKWAEKKGIEGIKQYQADNNLYSIDGLPTALQKNSSK